MSGQTISGKPDSSMGIMGLMKSSPLSSSSLTSALASARAVARASPSSRPFSNIQWTICSKSAAAICCFHNCFHRVKFSADLRICGRKPAILRACRGHSSPSRPTPQRTPRHVVEHDIDQGCNRWSRHFRQHAAAGPLLQLPRRQPARPKCVNDQIDIGWGDPEPAAEQGKRRRKLG